MPQNFWWTWSLVPLECWVVSTHLVHENKNITLRFLWKFLFFWMALNFIMMALGTGHLIPIKTWGFYQRRCSSIDPGLLWLGSCVVKSENVLLDHHCCFHLIFWCPELGFSSGVNQVLSYHSYLDLSSSAASRGSQGRYGHNCRFWFLWIRMPQLCSCDAWPKDWKTMNEMSLTDFWIEWFFPLPESKESWDSTRPQVHQWTWWLLAKTGEGNSSSQCCL